MSVSSPTSRGLYQDPVLAKPVPAAWPLPREVPALPPPDFLSCLIARSTDFARCIASLTNHFGGFSLCQALFAQCLAYRHFEEAGPCLTLLQLGHLWWVTRHCTQTPSPASMHASAQHEETSPWRAVEWASLQRAQQTTDAMHKDRE